jgi:3-hydroxybutyryl-CoA dehydrogenase
MGAGIAQVAAASGDRVVLYDVGEGPLNVGLARLRSALERAAATGRIDSDAAAETLARVTGTTDLASMADAELVIEAAPERLDLKQDIYRQLEAVVDPECVLATNTSTLSVGAIAGQLAHPERACGLHFFNPAPAMPLVEVVKGFATSMAVMDFASETVRGWGKTPIVVADTPGFIVNRVARPFYGEALRLLGDGVASAADVDRLARDAGFPMGPFELMDLIGIDVNLAAAQSVYDGFFQDPRFRPHPIQRQMLDSGRLGRKSGEGYYRYDSVPA